MKAIGVVISGSTFPDPVCCDTGIAVKSCTVLNKEYYNHDNTCIRTFPLKQPI